jgi:hypothetical protein
VAAAQGRRVPADNRNLRAAEELERLAAQIDKLEGSDIHKQISEAQDSINRACEANNGWDAWTDVSEATCCRRLQDQLDEAVPVPALDEQVANDPAVKAAKQAYNKAYAKAYTEARKRL